MSEIFDPRRAAPVADEEEVFGLMHYQGLCLDEAEDRVVNRGLLSHLRSLQYGDGEFATSSLEERFQAFVELFIDSLDLKT